MTKLTDKINKALTGGLSEDQSKRWEDFSTKFATDFMETESGDTSGSLSVKARDGILFFSGEGSVLTIGRIKISRLIEMAGGPKALLKEIDKRPNHSVSEYAEQFPDEMEQLLNNK